MSHGIPSAASPPLPHTIPGSVPRHRAAAGIPLCGAAPKPQDGPPPLPPECPGHPWGCPRFPRSCSLRLPHPPWDAPPPGPIAFSLPHPRLPQRPHSSDAQQHHPRCVPPQGSVRLCVCRRRRRCPPPPLPFMPQRPYSSSIRTQINTPPAKSPSIHPWGTLRAAPSPPARMGHSQPSIVQKGGTQPPPAPTLPPLRDDAPPPVPPPPHFAMPMDGGSGPSQWGWGRPSGGCWGVLHSDDAAGGALPGCGGLSGGALLMPIAVGGFCPRGDDWVGGSLMMLFTRVVGGGGSSQPPHNTTLQRAMPWGPDVAPPTGSLPILLLLLSSAVPQRGGGVLPTPISPSNHPHLAAGGGHPTIPHPIG